MLYQRYFMRMNQSNMLHVICLMSGFALALGLLLILRLSLSGNQPLAILLQRSENFFLAVTLLACILIYAGKSRKIPKLLLSHTKDQHLKEL